MAGYNRKTGKRVQPKKSYKNKSRYNKKRNYPLVRSMGTGVPDRISVKLKYSDLISLTTDANGIALYSFRGNSLYDPDYTSTGHQPLFHDNYASMYEHYIVRAAKINIQAVNHGGSDSCVLICNAGTDVFTSGDVNAQSTLEQGYSQRTSILSVASQNPSRLKMYASTAKALGLRPTQVYDADQFGAVFGTNPSDMWYFNIGVLAMNLTASQNVRVQVLITYYAEIFGRKKQLAN